MPQEYRLELFKSALTLTVAALSFAATWVIGHRLTVGWNLRQRRNELNQDSLQAFHALYGEFKKGIKIWRLAKRRLKSPVQVPENERWNLLASLCAIESKSEALVLRLTSERFLCTNELRAIGLFRQAVQTLRESIRDDVDCPLGSRRAEYELLNLLAPRVASIASAEVPKRLPDTKRAQDQLAEVIRVTASDWRQEVAKMPAPCPAPEEDEDA